MPSGKTIVVEELFKARWNEQTRTLSHSVVMLSEVSATIQSKNVDLSANNPANFFKDFIRRRASANDWWPRLVFEAGYTGRQVTEQGRCFEFIPIQPGQSEPFPANVPHPIESADCPAYKIESASLPLASRVLGRSDEAWLIQVAVKLRIIETHLSLFSSRREQILQVDHLQMSVKLRRTEIDSLFLAIERVGSHNEEVIVTCEAKGKNDDILVDQIVKQVKNVLTMPGISQNIVIPIAIRAFEKSKIHVVEFNSVLREEAEGLENLTRASQAIYELCPSVPGIGE